CLVSFVGPTGVRHSVEVSAESLYEAGALGVAALRADSGSISIVGRFHRWFLGLCLTLNVACCSLVPANDTEAWRASPKGRTGKQGQRGLRGRRGLQGPKGVTGSTGARGPAGESASRADILAAVSDQFAEMNKRLETQLTRICQQSLETAEI